MNVGAIDSNRIQAMLSQLKAAAQSPHADLGIRALTGKNPLDQSHKIDKPDFAETLKASLNQVNSVQNRAEKMGQDFAMGDDKVSLSDVMISMQKASISLQTTVQVRNKLVSAYHDIMNMQV
ncbi:MAG: flagellar hook-basal body complex protein FliE [Methylophilaceae bacterium]